MGGRRISLRPGRLIGQYPYQNRGEFSAASRAAAHPLQSSAGNKQIAVSHIDETAAHAARTGGAA
jgi:hypothetical protein